MARNLTEIKATQSPFHRSGNKQTREKEYWKSYLFKTPESKPKWLQVVKVISFYISIAKMQKVPLWRDVLYIKFFSLTRSGITLSTAYGQGMFCDMRYCPVPKPACCVLKESRKTLCVPGLVADLGLGDV